jgi:glycosyltransferase involved in cell wall biosynthesis
MSPKVSIVIPTYNRAGQYLIEALESALNQTYRNVEIIVVNDGSTDNTEAVLAPYMRHLRYIKRENGGCAAAKNTGLEYATGELITNLDDDDRIHPEKVERQVEMFMERPNLGICGTGVNFIDANGGVTECYMPPRFSRHTQVLQLLRRCVLVQSSVMIRRKCHERLGNYKLMLSEDYEFWLRAALHYEIWVVEEYLTDYRQHGDQITGPKTQPELMQAVKQLIRDFISKTRIEDILPKIGSEPEGNALIALLLCEQELFAEAESYLIRSLPAPAAHFVFGLLKIHEKQFSEAEAHFETVRMSDSPFALQVETALQLTTQVQAMLAQQGLDATSPEVVKLREDLSRCHAAAIRQLLALAKEKG